MVTSIVLLSLSLVCLLWAALVVVLMQSLRLAEGSGFGVRVVGGFVLMLGLLLVFPVLFAFASLVELLVDLVGTLCPACGERELEWESGTWKYGDPPAYRYFACANCRARFRQLCGGHGVLTELERV